MRFELKQFIGKASKLLPAMVARFLKIRKWAKQVAVLHNWYQERLGGSLALTVVALPFAPIAPPKDEGRGKSVPRREGRSVANYPCPL